MYQICPTLQPYLLVSVIIDVKVTKGNSLVLSSFPEKYSYILPVKGHPGPTGLVKYKEKYSDTIADLYEFI